MNTNNNSIGNSQLRLKVDIVELFALLNIDFNRTTYKQLKNAKLFIQTLQSVGINFSDIKLLLFNIVERLPVYTNLDIETLMKIELPVTEFDLNKNQ